MIPRLPLVIVTLAATMSLGCEAPVEAERTLPDSTLVEVLVDLHLAGARLRETPDAPVGIRDSVLARHGLDSTSFLAAMAWYEAHPDEYVAVYGTVLDRLSAGR